MGCGWGRFAKFFSSGKPLRALCHCNTLEGRKRRNVAVSRDGGRKRSGPKNLQGQLPSCWGIHAFSLTEKTYRQARVELAGAFPLNDTYSIVCSSWYILTDWLTGWPNGWMNVLLSACLSDWLPDWLTDLLPDWLTDWSTDLLIAWLTDYLTDWLPDWLITWLINRPTDWLTNRLTD